MISMNRPKMESRPYEFLLHHEIKRRLLPGRKVMTNLDSILKSRVLLKKEFIRPGLHVRPVHADHGWPPFQWTLNSVFSAHENNNRRIRPLQTAEP